MIYIYTQMEVIDNSQNEKENEKKSAKQSKEDSKRKAKDTVSDDGVLRPVKLSKTELYKAPTVEELNQLKEAENLFHCSILKMQVRNDLHFTGVFFVCYLNMFKRVISTLSCSLHDMPVNCGSFSNVYFELFYH